MPNSYKKVATGVGALALVAAGYGFLGWARNFVKADACADYGGWWNDRLESCETDPEYDRCMRSGQHWVHPLAKCADSIGVRDAG